MASRVKIVKSLEKLGIKPKHKDYSYHVTKFLINEEFKIQDISKQDEAKIEKVSSDFTYKLKNMYMNKFKYNLSRMEKKEKWFSEIIENPIIQPPTPKT